MNYHLSSDDLNRYDLGHVRGQELAIIQEHRLWCQECLNRAVENLRSIRKNGREHMGHISMDNLERHHLGQMDTGPTLDAAKHLSECGLCADRLEAVGRFISLGFRLKASGSGSRRGWGDLNGLVGAAVMSNTATVAR